MIRCWPLLVLATVAGCRLPPEREPLKPLPENGALYSYHEILTRARAQASAAIEAFYEDAWTDLEEAAKGLEQTARFLPRTSDQPPHLKDSLVQSCSELGKEATKLTEAARAKNITGTTEVLQRITLRIRALRPKEALEKSKTDKE
jgi:hypothetical protein